MLATQEACQSLYACPKTGQPLALAKDGQLAPSQTTGKSRYPVIEGIPILIDDDRSILDTASAVRCFAGSPIDRPSYTGASGFVKRLLSPEKTTTVRNVTKLRDLLRQRSEEAGRPTRVLVVAGGTIGQGMQPLYDDPEIEVFGFDLYRSPFTQFVADAHQIPLREGTFDAVVLQAVLEHVLEPERVVGEVWRVLKPEGFVYAETPFMQQVHEGAYDFTRFTESGHRYLFRRFGHLDSGVSGGPGLQLMWSMDYFFRSLFRSRAAGKAAKLAVFWLQYLDRIIPAPYAIDAASGTYFLGSRSDRAVTAREAVAHYGGAQ